MVVHPIRPDRMPGRKENIQRQMPYAAIPRAFWQHCWDTLTPQQRYLYWYLIGVEDWTTGMVTGALNTHLHRSGMSRAQFTEARDALVAFDFIAANDRGHMQRLTLPERYLAAPRELVTREDFERHDPATIRTVIARSQSGGRR